MFRTIDNQSVAVVPSPATGRRGPARENQPDSAAPAADQVDVSAEALRTPEAPVRTELVERIREEIADGTYLTPEKIEAAVTRLHRTISGG